MKVDPGKYNKNQKAFQSAIEKIYSRYPQGVTLSGEYAYFIDKDILKLLIRFARYKFVARILNETDRVLEVGCGSGIGSIFLSQHAKHVTGIDIKTTEIDDAKKVCLRKNVSFKVVDLYDMPANQKFDVVCALDVIEHFSANEGKKMIAEMAKHVKKFGMLIIGSPSVYSYPYQSRLSRTSHIKCYDQHELVDLIGNFFSRTLAFSMNDEIVHTGHPKLAWYYFVIAMHPKIKDK
ncbi:hypothetical protein A2154_03060 [Candidatus Gottesmanbacteria bacterium RBG_16_43_7]|uniref:Methyltransferase domain-containing protein n=1 Tax=Candidatus Gottesmanbacteria bacterium RBG_16_43_7 TaxID=1798373 RepID=A0A1F5ZAV7_9BACT|nr:MAG: hypothetical protein A2154_03060 [Candidatus Gottesmanbacteria bacterium RBG_16_43_7]